MRTRLLWILAAAVAAAAAAGTVWQMRFSEPPDLPYPRDWKPLISRMSPSFTPSETTVAEGEALSQVHCQTCHLRPRPDVLPVTSWYDVFWHHGEMVAGLDGINGVHLSRPTGAYRGYRIPAGDFTNIVYAYLFLAPEVVTLPDRPQLPVADAPFLVHYAEPYQPSRPAMYALASMPGQGGQIVLGDAVERALIVREPGGRVARRIDLPGVPTGLTVHDERLIVTLIGPQPYTTEEASGQVLAFPLGVLEDGSASPKVLLDALRRPVHTTVADLDGDGENELLVEEFGYSEGSLGYYDPAPGGAYEHRVLLDKSGALSAYVLDLNADGHADVLSLVSQATEGVYVHWGRGDGKFEQELLIQEHPAFGSNQMLVADLNGDSRPDIVLVNGDRMDLPSKPIAGYAGVHVYLNDGQNRFGERFFYPLVGAVQAVARDFDDDGDTEIVAVSATPDFSKTPLETAVYLDNLGDGKFVARPLPSAERGCWSVVAAGDLDGDGRDDLVLGGAYLPIFQREIERVFVGEPPLSLLILRNLGE